MMFVKLFASPGALHADQHRAVGQRLITELIGEEGAFEAVLDGAHSMTQVVVHEPQAWIVTTDADAPRYLVRITMPGSWNNRDMGAYLVARVTRVLAEFAAIPRGYIGSRACGSSSSACARAASARSAR